MHIKHDHDSYEDNDYANKYIYERNAYASKHHYEASGYVRLSDYVLQ